MIARFPSLRLEGGLISSDQIDRVADQKSKEFSIDDIAAAWSDVRSYWSIFEKSLAKLPEDNLATSETRNKWMIPFFSTLGYDLSSPRVAAEVDGQTYAISHRAGKDDNSPPIHIVGFRQSLDRRPESGRPRLAPHSLVQEYLNRTEHLWGIITNGSTLRILRDSNLLRKQAYIEFDLQQIMRDELFADFALLFRLIHASRLPKGIDDANTCQLEQIHKQTVEQGGRVRDHLSAGVERALTQFGNGFLNHPRNATLRAKVQDKSLEPFEFYEQLLRLIYRFLFLMVSEERNLISDNMTYRQYYSISRIRRLVEARAAYTNQEDLWLSLALTFKLFQDESLGPLLAVPTLNGDLFDPARTSELNEISLTNRDLLLAMWEICMYREKENAPWRRINYAALDVEELGSVYESLLEFQPAFVEQNGKPTFALLVGTERKSTGSYYTPPELVNELIQSALVPVIKDRLAPAKTPVEKETALLALSVCDPACGSGHFLLAAARTIGRELAKARTGDEEPAPEQMRIAIRDSITHCIYGVDKNPLAVDLCKVALWLEGHTKSKPLTFLDHRVRCGDSLVGVFDLSVLKDGIPDNAFTAVTGDDKAVARELKKQNQHEREHRRFADFDASLNVLTNSRQQVDAIADDKPSDIRKKKELFSAFQQEGTPWCKDKTACDLWISAFFVGLTSEQVQNQHVPTTETIREYISRGAGSNLPQVKIARQLASEYRFFHWALEFSDVFAKGGFDCVLGNPPWGKIKFQENDFFILRYPAIKNVKIKSQKNKIINELFKENPSIEREYLNNIHYSDAYSNFIHNNTTFSLTGVGDVNNYAIFSELAYNLINNKGNFGVLTPLGIATEETTKLFFKDLVNKNALRKIIGFENEEFLFPGIAHVVTFCLIVCSKNQNHRENPIFAYYVRSVKQLSEKVRFFELSREEISILNPNTKSCPTFRTKTDADLTLKIYQKNPILINDNTDANPWEIKFYSMFHMTNDSDKFHEIKNTDLLPLYEAKLFWHFDHRFASYDFEDQAGRWLPELPLKYYLDPGYSIKARYWVSHQSVQSKIKHIWKRKWLIVIRNIASAKVERTFTSTIIPLSGVGNSATIVTSDVTNTPAFSILESNFNSLVFDYITRQKVPGNNLNAFILKQLPVIPPDRYTPSDLAFIVPRVLELTYTAWDIKAFADDVWRDADDAMTALLRQQWETNKAATGGHEWKPPEWAEIAEDGIPLPPFKWDEERRAILRAELDALYARLYGLSRDELRYILDPADVYGPEFPGETFRVLKEKEIKNYGEYRTRRLVLEAWDRMDSYSEK